VHKSVGAVFAKWHRACPQVPIVIDVALELLALTGEHSEAANIKLAHLVKCWKLYVPLNNKCAVYVVLRLPYDCLNFSYFAAYGDALASVCIFAWLDNPKVLGVSLSLANLRQNIALVFVEELVEHGVLHSLLNVESQRQHFEGVSALTFVVLAHVVEKGKLIAQMVVSLYLAIAAPLVRDVF
jgi:hypothetical protein